MFSVLFPHDKPSAPHDRVDQAMYCFWFPMNHNVCYSVTGFLKVNVISLVPLHDYIIIVTRSAD